LVGVFSRSEALDPGHRPVILVDHFEKNQTARGIETAEILEIIDHHRVGGNIETQTPVRVDCRPIGSTASILACQFRENALSPNRRQAMLLLGALISDTLLLTSPTTTPLDHQLAAWLAQLAEVDLQTFGREVLKQNDQLASGEPHFLVEKDLKEFSHDDITLAIAQLETVNLELFTTERREALTQALHETQQRRNVDFAVLMVTDVFRSESHVLSCDPNVARARYLLECEDPIAGRIFPKMVSRKKQLLPLLLERLQTFKT
jgi:manganese-dependent inorganic pyrophosphatase